MLKRLLSSKQEVKHLKSYSQSGEDLIVNYIFSILLKIDKVNYLDIGAFHPYQLSNTYFFYDMGMTGVCIEANPQLISPFKDIRPNDKTLNIGISIENTASIQPFYIFSNPVLSTFSKKEADRMKMINNNEIVEVKDIETIPINQIIEDNFETCPNFISIDIEGFDLQLIKSMDFNKYRPKVICIETVSHVEEKKDQELISEIINNGYVMYADTFINSIFIEKSSWEKRFENYR